MIFSGRKGDLLRPVAIFALAIKLAPPTDGFGLFAFALFGRLFIISAKFHFAEDTFALKLFLQDLEGLIDVVFTDADGNQCVSPLSGFEYRAFLPVNSRHSKEKDDLAQRSLRF
jgi:hypothetical protein